MVNALIRQLDSNTLGPDLHVRILKQKIVYIGFTIRIVTLLVNGSMYILKGIYFRFLIDFTTYILNTTYT